MDPINDEINYGVSRGYFRNSPREIVFSIEDAGVIKRVEGTLKISSTSILAGFGEKRPQERTRLFAISINKSQSRHVRVLSAG